MLHTRGADPEGADNKAFLVFETLFSCNSELLTPLLKSPAPKASNCSPSTNRLFQKLIRHPSLLGTPPLCERTAQLRVLVEVALAHDRRYSTSCFHVLVQLIHSPALEHIQVVVEPRLFFCEVVQQLKLFVKWPSRVASFTRGGGPGSCTCLAAAALPLPVREPASAGAPPRSACAPQAEGGRRIFSTALGAVTLRRWAARPMSRRCACNSVGTAAPAGCASGAYHGNSPFFTRSSHVVVSKLPAIGVRPENPPAAHSV